MSVEPKKVSEKDLGALQGCLVEGDPEQRARERRIRRRSLVLSVVLQGAVLVAVVLVPLFARTERIALANITPVPPYSPYRHVSSAPTGPHAPTPINACHICAPPNIPPRISTQDPTPTDGPQEPQFGNTIGSGVGGPDGYIPITDSRPRPPEQPTHHAEQPHIVHVTNIDPAFLKRRVDPIYPPLPRQIHKEGRVELHAIIGIDGTIQSLQIMSGDPMFYQSALAAVQQWVYKPTYLNGQPVEVDTTITVIYSMPR